MNKYVNLVEQTLAERAKASGKVQERLLTYINSKKAEGFTGDIELSDIARNKMFLGVVFNKIQNAAKGLMKKELIDGFDGVSTITITDEPIEESKTPQLKKGTKVLVVTPNGVYEGKTGVIIKKTREKKKNGEWQEYFQVELDGIKKEIHFNPAELQAV